MFYQSYLWNFFWKPSKTTPERTCEESEFGTEKNLGDTPRPPREYSEDLKNTQTNLVGRYNVENLEARTGVRFLRDKGPSKSKASKFSPPQSEDGVFNIPRPHNTGDSTLGGGSRKFNAYEFPSLQSANSIFNVKRLEIPKPHNTGDGALSGGPCKLKSSELYTHEFRDSVLSEGPHKFKASELFRTQFTHCMVNVKRFKISKPRTLGDVILSIKPRHFESRMVRVRFAPLNDYNTELSHVIDMLG